MPPSPGLPGVVQLYEWLRDPHALLDRSFRRLGPVFTLDLSILSRATVIVTLPAHVRAVFVAPHEVLSAGEASAVFEPFVGPGSLFLLDGAGHARHRRLMGPSFRGERMAEYFEDIVTAIDDVAPALAAGGPCSFLDLARKITLGALVRAVFGARGASALAVFGQRARETIDICARPHLLLAPARIDLGPWSPWGKVLRTLRALDLHIYEQIAAVRASADLGRRDVLSLLARTRDENDAPLSDAEIRDELVTLLVAGNETTATTLAWAVDEILRAPRRVLSRMLREIDDVTGGRDLEADDVPRLGYLDLVVREVLRLHPPVMNTIRVVKEPFRLDRWELPPGTELAPCMHLTHRLPELYPDPLAFDPERFAGKKPDPYAYFPFGGGSRRCMGRALALFELKVTLARLFARFSFTLRDRRRPRAQRRALVLAPDTGVNVIARERRA